MKDVNHAPKTDEDEEGPEEAEKEEAKKRVVTDGYLEEEYRVSSEEAGEFLVGIGERLRDGDELEVEGDNWRIPFRFGDTVEIEVEYDGSDGELEFEIELEEVPDDDAPEVP